MFGLIVITQIVNYPLFSKVSFRNFSDYYSFYVSRISIIVIPSMLIELSVSFFLFLYFDIYIIKIIFFVNILIFLSTFFIQVPIHEKIKYQPRFFLFKNLVFTNIIRTLLWGLKSIFSFILLLKELV